MKKEKKVQELFQYLSEKDIEFIKEMIDPPKKFFDDDGQWMLKGRPASKGYLYEIVNNIHHGIDVDKLDYLARDSHHTGVDVAIGPHFISRFINGIEIQKVDGEERLTFNGKLADDIPDVLNSRKSLFMKVYYHKKVYPIEYQVQKAITLALPHLKVRGENDELKTLKECLTEPIDIKAYIKLDDHIISLIKHSEVDHPDMDEARKCIENVERRKVHTVILKVHFYNVKWDESLEKEVQTGIQMITNSVLKSREKKEIIHITRHYHFGKGPNVDPSGEVLYRSRSNAEERPRQGFI